MRVYVCECVCVCLLTGYVPDGCGKGKITPIVKDKLGDIGKVTSYRPITIVCILSKVFELCILEFVEQFMPKKLSKIWSCKRWGCEKTCLCLRSIFDYFTLRGSNVFVAALDSSKAFNKVNHYGLLLKMINARAPVFVIRVIGNFYSK